MTIEELLAAMQAVIDEADASDEAEMSEEQVARYEELEEKLVRARSRDQLQRRNAAYQSVDASQYVTGAKPKADDTLDRAFGQYMRTGRENADLVELRAQSTSPDAAGGFIVPDLFRDKLVDRMRAFGGIAGAAEEITTSGGEILRWPTLDDTSNVGVIAAEGVAPTSGGADLVFGERILSAFKYVAPGLGNLPLRVSVELLQDSNFDVEGLVSRKLGERIGRKQAVDFVSGAGTTLPFGITTGTAATAFTSPGITYAELVAAVHSVDPAYRESASWAFNDATLALIESIVDLQGRPILYQQNNGFQDIAVGRAELRLLGYPVVIDQAFPTYVDGGINRWGVFGDLRAGYVIRRVQGLTLIVNPYSRANEGQVEYTLWARADGTVQDPNAYRVLINAV